MHTPDSRAFPMIGHNKKSAGHLAHPPTTHLRMIYHSRIGLRRMGWADVRILRFPWPPNRSPSRLQRCSPPTTGSDSRGARSVPWCVSGYVPAPWRSHRASDLSWPNCWQRCVSNRASGYGTRFRASYFKGKIEGLVEDGQKSYSHAYQILRYPR